jgi:hypothetical protein
MRSTGRPDRSTGSKTRGEDRFNDLYNLARRIQQRPKQDKTTEQIEFEKAQKELTFQPNVERKMSIKQMDPYEANNIKITDDKVISKDIERIRKAREEKERIKQFTERGIILKEPSLAQKRSSVSRQKPMIPKHQTPMRPPVGAQKKLETASKT